VQIQIHAFAAPRARAKGRHGLTKGDLRREIAAIPAGTPITRCPSAKLYSRPGNDLTRRFR